MSAPQSGSRTPSAAVPFSARPATSSRWYSKSRFFILPVELVLDTQLTHVDKAVLVAIASHVFREDTVFPSRRALSARCGVSEANVSHCTRRLEELGWITKHHSRDRAVRYTLHVPQRLIGQQSRPGEKVSETSPQPDQVNPKRQGQHGGGAAPSLSDVPRERPEDPLERAYDEDANAYDRACRAAMDDDDAEDEGDLY